MDDRLSIGLVGARELPELNLAPGYADWHVDHTGYLANANAC